MRYLILLVVFVCFVDVSAQIEATTKEGKEVILHDDGSWQYVVVDPVIDKSNMQSDFSANSEIQELHYTVSPRLRKYFGEQKGKIRGRALCMVDSGQVKISFQWEVILADAYRYFGYLKPGKKITLKTKNNGDVILFLTEDVNYEVVSKYDYAVFKGTCAVSPDQLDLLLKFPVTHIEVDWKKEPESYELKNANYFKDTFTSLLTGE